MTRLQSIVPIRCALAATLALALAPAGAQSRNAAIAAEGRPVMSGAQGGLGAQPGLAQGGLGLQDGATQVTVPLKRPGHKDLPAATASLPAVTPTVTLAPPQPHPQTVQR
ncbi:MAG: hypothetical protein KF686_11655 [Ramlibacter sp.]|nr:hypothetical protein [Ramlibacter sp.]MBX3659815.1 hypothetical protein [Ramlibacter sp.]